MTIPKHVTFECCTEKIDIQDIETVEATLGVKFPRDYVECMLENNDGSPVPCGFDYGEVEGKVFNTFYSLSKEVGHYYILKAFWINQEYLPDGVVPIGYDASGGYVCFNYINGKHAEPIVVYADHEIMLSERDLGEEELKEKSMEEWQREGVCQEF
ncbi:SMI1/KNR4 family protein, partial [Brevibacillus fortis]